MTTRVCYECERVGTRRFHQIAYGPNEGRWRCTSRRMCEYRAWRKWGKDSGWKWTN